MTYTELERYKYIKRRIKGIENQIAELTVLSATKYDGMPHGSQTSDSVYVNFLRYNKLIEKLQFQKKQLIAEEEKITDFINSIDDIEIQTIIQMKFIELNTYEEIGDELYMHRTTVVRKLNKFLNDYNNAHNAHK